MATDRERPPDRTRLERGESPFQLTAEWQTGPRTRAWDELWRWLLTEAPEGAGDGSLIAPISDGHVRCIRDAASGATLEREGLEELRGALRRGEADVVISYAVDRLSRSQDHIGILFDEFERAEVRMEFVTERFEDTAVGRFILAARAFITQVEREKIVERTTRGKTERARSGRIPQAFGIGCYGYVYNPATGRREIEPFQAVVVRGIFERYPPCQPLVRQIELPIH